MNEINNEWNPLLVEGDEFITLTYEDETSEFDPKAHWEPGVECYMRTFSCRIPKSIMNNDEAIDKYIDEHAHLEGFWVDGLL